MKASFRKFQEDVKAYNMAYNKAHGAPIAPIKEQVDNDSHLGPPFEAEREPDGKDSRWSKFVEASKRTYMRYKPSKHTSKESKPSTSESPKSTGKGPSSHEHQASSQSSQAELHQPKQEIAGEPATYDELETTVPQSNNVNMNDYAAMFTEDQVHSGLDPYRPTDGVDENANTKQSASTQSIPESGNTGTKSRPENSSQASARPTPRSPRALSESGFRFKTPDSSPCQSGSARHASEKVDRAGEILHETEIANLEAYDALQHCAAVAKHPKAKQLLEKQIKILRLRMVLLKRVKDSVMGTSAGSNTSNAGNHLGRLSIDRKRFPLPARADLSTPPPSDGEPSSHVEAPSHVDTPTCEETPRIEETPRNEETPGTEESPPFDEPSNPTVPKQYELCEQLMRRVFPNKGNNVRVTGETGGSYNAIVFVKYPDLGEKYCIRVPFKGVRGRWGPEDETKLRSEVLLMRLIKKATRVALPEVFDFCVGFENELGAPYTVTSFVKGKTICEAWGEDPQDGKTSLVDKRKRILKTLSDNMAELAQLSFSKIGEPQWETDEYSYARPDIVPAKWDDYPDARKNQDPANFLVNHKFLQDPSFESSYDYFASRLDKKLDDMSRAGVHEHRELGALQFLQLFIDCSPGMKRHGERFTLQHTDLDMQNVMCDDQGYVTGILDWDGVKVMPAHIGAGLYPSWLQRDWNPWLWSPVYIGSISRNPRPFYTGNVADIRELRAYYNETLKDACYGGALKQDPSEYAQHSHLYFALDKALRMEALGHPITELPQVLYTLAVKMFQLMCPPNYDADDYFEHLHREPQRVYQDMLAKIEDYLDGTEQDAVRSREEKAKESRVPVPEDMFLMDMITTNWQKMRLLGDPPRNQQPANQTAPQPFEQHTIPNPADVPPVHTPPAHPSPAQLPPRQPVPHIDEVVEDLTHFVQDFAAAPRGLCSSIVAWYKKKFPDSQAPGQAAQPMSTHHQTPIENQPAVRPIGYGRPLVQAPGQALHPPNANQTGRLQPPPVERCLFMNNRFHPRVENPRDGYVSPQDVTAQDTGKVLPFGDEYRSGLNGTGRHCAYGNVAPVYYAHNYQMSPAFRGITPPYGSGDPSAQYQANNGAAAAHLPPVQHPRGFGRFVNQRNGMAPGGERPAPAKQGRMGALSAAVRNGLIPPPDYHRAVDKW